MTRADRGPSLAARLAKAEAGEASAFAPGVESVPMLDEDAERCERLLRGVVSRRSGTILTEVKAYSGDLPLLP